VKDEVTCFHRICWQGTAVSCLKPVAHVDREASMALNWRGKLSLPFFLQLLRKDPEQQIRGSLFCVIWTAVQSFSCSGMLIVCQYIGSECEDMHGWRSSGDSGGSCVYVKGAQLLTGGSMLKVRVCSVCIPNMYVMQKELSGMLTSRDWDYLQ